MQGRSLKSLLVLDGAGEMKAFIGFLLFVSATADIHNWVGLPEQKFKQLDDLLQGEYSVFYQFSTLKLNLSRYFFCTTRGQS